MKDGWALQSVVESGDKTFCPYLGAVQCEPNQLKNKAYFYFSKSNGLAFCTGALSYSAQAADFPCLIFVNPGTN
jgi:hypothetical protein